MSCPQCQAGVCSHCLSLCLSVDIIAEKVLSALCESNYQVLRVSLQLNLPPSFVIRRRLSTTNVDVKEMLRSKIAKHISSNGFELHSPGMPEDIVVELQVTHQEAEDQLKTLFQKIVPTTRQSKNKRHKNNDMSQTDVDIILKRATDEDLQSILETSLATECALHVNISRQSVFVTGRYMKFARGVSQSPWTIGNERHGSGCVSDFIALDIESKYSAESHKFHGAGREDIDVRMLGNGRPFVLELINCKVLPTDEGLMAIQENVINTNEAGSVMVRELKLSDKSCMTVVVAGETNKRKQYSAIVWSAKKLSKLELEKKLDCIQDMEIEQNTPVRVLHRRTSMYRTKIIHSCRCEYINSHFFIMRLEASAGTYIKEFVHGDFGRTVPSVGSLLDSNTDIIQLDVEAVIMS